MEGRYTISILTKITGLPAHYLRRLEKTGLLSPCRSQGGHRLYTQQDLEIIFQVKHLKEKGINMAGICEILKKKQ
ncbi:MAG: MerR family transcriptional regulator [Dehalococcoidales bacterium]|nr:MerR family transcriptional regulator [Dehalococcoidales bacterium]NLE90129.1 MerR family transcriptional regulator [Dehalococcoidales bacterium]